MMLTTIDDVLTSEECVALIARAAPRLEPMSAMGPEIDFRVAHGAWLNQPTSIVDKLRHHVADVTGLPVAHQELPHVVRYPTGGEYKPHDDGFHHEDYYDEVMRHGGQRAFSAMVWLNDGYEGGATHFTAHELTFSPAVGTMLVWSNLEHGEVDVRARHAGLPVARGEKWIVTVWVRERPHTAVAA